MKRVRADLLWLLFLAFVLNLAVIHGRRIPVGGNGGDTIIHMAMIRGIYLGRNPFLDQHYNIYPNWYPFLYHSIIALLAKLTHVSIWNLMIWTPLLFAMLMVASWYLLGQELDEKYGGLLLGALSFLIMGSQLFPNPKALVPILLPLVYLEILRYIHGGRRKHAVYAGVLLGLMMWSHIGAALPVLIGVSLYVSIKLREDRNLILIPLIATVMISPYFLNIILHIQPRATGIVEGKWLRELTFDRTFLRIQPPVWGLILIFIAVFLALKRKENREFWRFMSVSIGAMLIVNLIPSVFYSAIGLKIFPSRFAIPLHYNYLLVYMLGLIYLINVTNKKTWMAYFVAFLLIVYGSLNFVHYNYACFSSEHTYMPFESLAGNYTKGLLKVSEWIRGNTKRDDYLIGHPYTLEWIAGLTGRPVVAVSYGHGNPFINMKQRREDIRQFFTNPSKRVKIIEKYGIKYIILGPWAERDYNVTFRNFENGDFRIVFHWWKFYLLEVER